MRRRGGRERALGTRAPAAVPQEPNQRSSLDFVSDTLDDGQRVARELDRIIAGRGKPLMIVSDNGTELTSHPILRWQEERAVEWHGIAPG